MNKLALYTIKIGDTTHEIYRTYDDPSNEKKVFQTCIADKLIAGRDKDGNYVAINLEGFSTIHRKKIEGEEFDLLNLDIDTDE